MALTTVAANTMLLSFRPSTGGTFVSIVCEVDSNINMTMEVTTDSTKCGSTTAPGSITTTLSGNGVVNTTPTGGSEASYNDMLSIFLNQTQIDWEYTNADGDIQHAGIGWFTQLGNQNASTGTSKFTWTLSANGTPTNSAFS